MESGKDFKARMHERRQVEAKKDAYRRRQAEGEQKDD